MTIRVEVTVGGERVDMALPGLSSLALVPVKILPLPCEALRLTVQCTVAISPATREEGSSIGTKTTGSSSTHLKQKYILMEQVTALGSDQSHQIQTQLTRFVRHFQWSATFIGHSLRIWEGAVLSERSRHPFIETRYHKSNVLQTKQPWGESESVGLGMVSVLGHCS